VGSLPNAPHTTQSPLHATYWTMWLAHSLLGRPLSRIDSVYHYADNDGITVETGISGTPSIREVRVWATSQSDRDFSAWNEFASYPMSPAGGGLYRGRIPRESTAFFVEVVDEADGVAGMISSSPVPTDKDYPLLPQAPADVNGFLVEAGTSAVSLSWSNPVDSDFAGVIIRSSREGYPAATGGQAVHDGTGTGATQAKGNENIYYSAFTYDAAGNYSAGSTARICPAGKGEETVFAADTGLLRIPEVAVGSMSYAVDMQYAGGLDFDLTGIGPPLCAESVSTFDTRILHMPEVVAGSDTYTVDMQYTGGLDFTVTGVESE